MPGFVSVIGACVRCRQPFEFSPTKVPSALIDGVRQPICRSCFEWLNGERERQGMERVPLLPGAYEADAEEEVPWDD